MLKWLTTRLPPFLPLMLVTQLFTLSVIAFASASETNSSDKQPSDQQQSINHTDHKDPVHFDSRKLRLVDTTFDVSEPDNANYLFRGNMPLIDDHFAYDELLETMTKALEEHNLSLPDNLLMIDISLISNVFEHHLLEIEQQFANRHPHQLFLIHHPVYGALSNPNHHLHLLHHHLLHLPFIEGTYQLVESLHHLMHKDFGRPVALFVHCRGGSDRTGMVIGAYQMQFMNMSYHDVVKEAESVARRPLRPLQRNGLKWIAYYLRDVMHIHTVGEI